MNELQGSRALVTGATAGIGKQTALQLARAGAPAARIVNVSSDAHRMTRLDFDDLMAERRYNEWVQYGRSKLANIYFTRELARRLSYTKITVNCLHPGFVASEFLSKEGGF